VVKRREEVLGSGLLLMEHESASSRSIPEWLSVFLYLGVPAYLYLNAFAFPNIPIHLDGDQTFFWSYALRMMDGEFIYRDFFQFTPPGTDFVFLIAFKLFGARIWVMNAVTILLGTVLCWVCFGVARWFMSLDWALFAACSFLVLVYSRIMDATHHWFSLLLLLSSVRILMPAWATSRIALAGLLFALASFFTQTAGLVGVAALLLSLAWEGVWARRGWRAILARQLFLLAVFAVALGVLDTYLIVKLGWRRLWYFQADYPSHYVEYGLQRFVPSFHGLLNVRSLPDLLRRLFVYTSLLIVYPLVLWHCWRRRGEPMVKNALLLSLIGLLLFLVVINRLNWTRVYAVSAPGLLLLPWVISRSSRLPRFVLPTAWTIIAFVAVAQTWTRHHNSPMRLELPAGTSLLSAQKYEKFSWLQQHTNPGDWFYQAYWVNVYPALELRSPVYLDFLVANEETRPEFAALSLQQLEQAQVKYILWSPKLNGPFNPRRPWEDHLGPIRTYVHEHYTLLHVFSDREEIWARKPLSE
jgi:hypothetical protein